MQTLLRGICHLTEQLSLYQKSGLAVNYNLAQNAVRQWQRAERRTPALRGSISYVRAELELCAPPSLTDYREISSDSQLGIAGKTDPGKAFECVPSAAGRMNDQNRALGLIAAPALRTGRVILQPCNILVP